MPNAKRKHMERENDGNVAEHDQTAQTDETGSSVGTEDGEDEREDKLDDLPVRPGAENDGEATEQLDVHEFRENLHVNRIYKFIIKEGVDLGDYRSKTIVVTNCKSSASVHEDPVLRLHLEEFEGLCKTHATKMQGILIWCDQWKLPSDVDDTNSLLDGFTFLLTDRMDVDGGHASQFAKFLKRASGDTSDVLGDFKSYFLIDPTGQVVHRFKDIFPSEIPISKLIA